MADKRSSLGIAKYTMHPVIVDELEKLWLADLRRWLRWMVFAAIAAFVVLMGAFAAYAIVFRRHSIVADAGAWGQFGDFLGGTVNPIIGFLTFLAAVLTLALLSHQLQLSSSELKLSRDELALTRSQLERSATAQELSDQALRAQAESAARTSNLTALNFLLASYRAELASYQERPFVGNDARVQRSDVLRGRLATLEQMIDTLFAEVASNPRSPQ